MTYSPGHVSSMSRSISSGYFQGTSAGIPMRASSVQPEISGRRMHLITVDLWEQISGEKVTPNIICDLQDSMFPLSNFQQSFYPNSHQSMHYLQMSKDRNDCRTLQQQIQDGKQEFRDLVFDSLTPHFYELVNDPTANYVYQKICEVATPKQKEIILNCFLQDLPRIIEQSNGCRVLQKFIECSDAATVDILFVQLRFNLKNLCLSLNGNHIVRRFIESLPNRILEIINILKPHVLTLVGDNCGCRVIQKLFEQFSNQPLEPLEPLITPVLEDCVRLAPNQYGNYVVQIILGTKNSRYITKLIQQFKGHFYDFSFHKFASNVIEVCIKVASNEQRAQISDEIIGVYGHYREDRIKKMVSDQFGNYVVQRILEFGDQYQLNAIFRVVYDNYDLLRNITYSKHVIAFLTDLGYEF